MKSLNQSNSWHWLFISVAISLLVGGYIFATVWKKSSSKLAPDLERMKSHGEELVLLDETDAITIEKQVADLKLRLEAYEGAVDEQGGKPVPKGEQSVLKLSNEINSNLQRNELRIVEREQVSERAADPSNAPDKKVARRGEGKGNRKEKKEVKFPYKTREIHYVVEGPYTKMFMFLVKESHRKPSYHFKNIQIIPAPDREGMRMTFTVEIHFT